MKTLASYKHTYEAAVQRFEPLHSTTGSMGGKP